MAASAASFLDRLTSGWAETVAPASAGATDHRLDGPTIVKQKKQLMAKAQLDKTSVITDYRAHEKDTGSAEVQIALLTQRVTHLTEHLRTHRKDFHSRRGLIAMTNRRRKLLDYVKKHDLDKYRELLERLKLRR